MSSWTLVAIPRSDDPTWRYSSEKVPHLTILFLGDQPESTQPPLGFIAHAVDQMVTRFGLSVDRRGTLGEKNADVLFFDKDFAKKLEDFREALLKNPEVRRLYDSTEQYPVWNPHLTMGYPETPAKYDDRDYTHYNWVEFDRIALWTGDYEGFEIPLKDDAGMMLEEAYMSEKVEDFLEHYGVKGMRWGKRKAASSPKQASSVDRRKVDAIKKKPVSQLSNKQLKALNERMRLEQEYNKLNPSRTSAGRKFVTDLLVNTAKQSVQNTASKYATQGLQTAIELAVATAKKK